LKLRRKQRDLDQLQHDPEFLFYVGRLVGAAETTSHYLQLQDNIIQSQEMGRLLGKVTGWFLTDEPVSVNTEITQVLPPK
jgi:hypothetical protein